MASRATVGKPTAPTAIISPACSGDALKYGESQQPRWKLGFTALLSDAYQMPGRNAAAGPGQVGCASRANYPEPRQEKSTGGHHNRTGPAQQPGVPTCVAQFVQKKQGTITRLKPTRRDQSQTSIAMFFVNQTKSSQVSIIVTVTGTQEIRNADSICKCFISSIKLTQGSHERGLTRVARRQVTAPA